MLPMSSLCEPPSNILLRDTNGVFVAALKKELLENPTGGFLISSLYTQRFPYCIIIM